MGYCQTKLCHKVVELRDEYGSYDKMPTDIKKSIGLCKGCAKNASIEDLKRGGMDRD